MRQIFAIGAAVIAAVVFIGAVFTLSQANQEQLDLTSRLQSRAQLLADSMSDSITPSFETHATSSVQSTIDKFASQQRIVGIGVFDTTGAPVALSSGFPSDMTQLPIVAIAMDSSTPTGQFFSENGTSEYAFAEPIIVGQRVIGALVDVQNSQYISDAVLNIWREDLLHIFLQVLFFTVAIFLLVRYVFFSSVQRIAESIRSVRSGEAIAPEQPGIGFLQPLTSEIAKMSTSLRQARHAASEEARLRLEKLDTPWTAERLKEFVKAYLRGRPIFVISNAEPYVNHRVRGGLEWSVPAGGVITAIEPIMEACGGMWIAQASGDADAEVIDEQGKLRVPPEEPKYTLKRVFLSEEERAGYYKGFANEALWPLCHQAHVRPQFRADDWAEYKKVNALFVKSLLEEIRHIERPIVLVQDFHLALVPALVKKARPDCEVAMFWHIPWPSAAQFSICPWRKEPLEGMLGADLCGFHTQQYCNNFMDTVAAEVESRIDYEKFAVIRGGHETVVEPFPISIAFPGSAEITTPPERGALESLGIRSEYVALGVDRLDYIKGIPERFRAVEFLFESHPEYREHFTLLQIGSPTRAGAGVYGQYAAQVVSEAERINQKYGTGAWRPIVLEQRSYSHEALRKLYQVANVMLVTSLHDGMNLVAKEYVAARSDELGVLVLSHFTGASRELTGALIVNPYSAEETAEAIHLALAMPESEQHRRMTMMRSAVRDYNIYRWSAEILKSLADL